MDLKFERGNAARPCGHALIYFTGPDPDSASATYVILLPVVVDIKKYVPPFLAGQIEGMSAADMTAFAFPPAPEPVQSAAWVRAIAEARGDDLLYAGPGGAKDAAVLMGKVSEIVAEYRRLYAARGLDGGKILADAPEGLPAAPVEDVVYSMMSEVDLLTELTTLVGRLRYAVEGGDRAAASETEGKIRAIGRRLPENRRVSRLAEIALDPSPESSMLAQLYIERAYALFREDYLRVKGIEKQIAQLEAG